MKYIIYVLFFICLGLSVKAQVPTGFPSQRWAGWIEPTYNVPDSGNVITKRDTNWIPSKLGMAVTWFHAGVDTVQWFWNGLHWGRVSPAQLDTTSLSNRINLKLNIVDTTGKWLAQTSRLVDTVYRVNDSTVGYTIKGQARTFQILGRLPSGGTGTVTSVALSMPAAFTVSGSPLTGTGGTINVSGAGTSAQYVKGNMTLGTTDTSMIPSFFTKVRGLFSGISPITYNSFTGVFGILNANEFGQKGVSTYNNTDFFTDGNGTVFIRNIPGDWCNIVKYGADTLGINDASPVIQSLINSGCRVIYGPHGNYKLNSTIQMKDSVTIMGDGKSTVFHLTQNQPGFRCGQTTGQWCTFKDFTIAGSYVIDSTQQEGIRADTVKGLLFFNVYFFKTAGPAIHFKKNVSSTESNTVLACYFDSCRKASFAESEFNKYIGNTIAYCDTGLKIGYGSNTVDHNNITKGSIGIYLYGRNAGGEFNDAHTVISGNIIAHNFFAGLYVDGVTNGEQFGHNIIRNNSVYDVYMQNSDNIWFDNDDLGVDSLVFINCTNTNISSTCKIWSATTGRPASPDQFPRWRIVGDTPTIAGSGWYKNSFSLYDVVDNKIFNVKHVNNVVDFSTTNVGKLRTSDTVESPIVIGSEVYNGNFHLYGSSNITTGNAGNVFIGNHFALLDSVTTSKDPMLGVGQTSFRGYYIDLQLKRRGIAWIHSENDSSTTLSGAGLRLNPPLGHRADIYMTDPTFIGGAPGDALVIYSSGAVNGMKIVADSGPIEIGASQAPNTSIFARYNVTTGDFQLRPGAATDNGATFQDYGAMTLNKDSIPIVTSLTTQMVALIDTANKNQIERATIASIFGNTLYTGDGTANNRTVTVTGSTMTFTSALTSPTPTLTVNNTSSGHAILGSASGAGYGVYGTGFRGVYGNGTGGGTGMYGQETSGIGGRTVVTTGTSLEVDHTPTSFNDIQTAQLITRLTSGNSGNGANGIGTAIQFAAPTTTTTSASVGGALNWYWATATNASRKGAFSLQTVTNAGSLTDKLIVSDDIQLNANSYIFKKIDNTVPYTKTITSGNNSLWEGYTPTPTVFNKGAGVIIDTNNNVGLGVEPTTSLPLYTSGVSTFVNGFQNQAGNFLRVDSISVNITVPLTMYYIRVNATSGNITLTLPSAATAFGGSMGVLYKIIKIDGTANTVTIARAGGDLINGATSQVISSQYDIHEVQCTSTTTWAYK